MLGIDALPFAFYEEGVDPTITEANQRFGESLYEDTFFLSAVPGDAFPSDYFVDDQGVVQSFYRVYRGSHLLR